jgi:hypothetical protein
MILPPGAVALHGGGALGGIAPDGEMYIGAIKNVFCPEIVFMGVGVSHAGVHALRALIAFAAVHEPVAQIFADRLWIQGAVGVPVSVAALNEHNHQCRRHESQEHHRNSSTAVMF